MVGVYVSTDRHVVSIHTITFDDPNDLITIHSYSFHQLDVHRYPYPPFLYSTIPVRLASSFINISPTDPSGCLITTLIL